MVTIETQYPACGIYLFDTPGKVSSSRMRPAANVPVRLVYNLDITFEVLTNDRVRLEYDPDVTFDILTFSADNTFLEK